ncbi:uncharacterized protein BJ171DRAFT_460986 [Polychytrium aggregatum]|uniref:uncharacterized protein n=1 Tax=Polychytrium aggregatum TaxID=110093 RepID=UPI0022FE06BB|nr:uncharacterized protein BJ171DRAFT_460986 [Polychytrium aggregatum]KAI9202882.1 hypothetical protein BJ171DRAFT_460986 [Polychytrium aggregatum]
MSQGDFPDTTDAVLESVDIYYILFAIAPLAVISVASALIDDSVLVGLRRPSVESPTTFHWSLLKLWHPRWQVLKATAPRPSFFGNAWSLGEVLIVALLVISNLAWVFVPIIQSPPSSVPASAALYNWVQQITTQTAWAGLWDAGLCILFVVRENLITKKALGHNAGQYHRSNRFHIGLGYTSFLLITAHAIFNIVDFINKGRVPKSFFPWASNYGYGNLGGLLAWLSLLGIAATSVYKVRRSNYRVFYWTHQLYVTFFLFALIHKGTNLAYPFIFPCLYFVYDRLRARVYFRRFNATASVQKTLSDTIIKVDIPIADAWQGASTYAPGDWVNICVPQISALHWHPFSIASYCHDTPDRITLLIKVGGKWTTKLAKLCEHQDKVHVPIKVDGPFGSRSVSYLHHERLLMLVGGSGISAVLPFIYHYTIAGPASGKMRLIWTVKDESTALAYSSFLLDYVNKSTLLSSKLTLDLHITGSMKTDPDTDSPDHIDSAKDMDADHAKAVKDNVILDDKIANITKRKAHWKARLTDLALACVVFGFGIAGFVIGILVRPAGAEADKCDSNTAFKLVGLDHFLCWYLEPLSSSVLSIAFATIAGLLFLRLFVTGGSSSAPNAALSAADDSDSASHLSEGGVLHNLILKLNVNRARPDFKVVTEEMDKYAGEKGTNVAVLGAGPERLMRTLQHIVVGCKHLDWYRESWKV